MGETDLHIDWIADRAGSLRCLELGISLRLEGENLVMYDLVTGEVLQTEAEAEAAAREAEQTARAAAQAAQEAEHALRESEQAARQAAESRVAELEAELRRLQAELDRGGGGDS